MELPSIFITGAGAGIGRATALFFASKGWFVGLYDQNQEAVEALAAEIGTERCCYAVMDVCDEQQVAAALAQFATHTGGSMEVLFNNAGILQMGVLRKIPLAEHYRSIKVNLWGVVNCTYQALPLLQRGKAPRIVNMSSASALYGVPEFGVYSATKHAVSALTEALNIELEKEGIFVCDILPPFVKTDMLEKANYRAGSVAKMGVHLQAEDIAQVVWKAATGRKRIHWIVSTQLKILNLVGGWFPSLKRAIMKKMTLG